jgi:malonyl-CoA O-methyltransferase
MQKEVAKLLSHHFDPVEGELLEIGCGTGFLTEEILRFFPGPLTGLDLSKTMIEVCQAKFPSAYFIQKDAEELSENQRYAAIFSGMTLQWFQQPKKSLSAIRKALKKGGTFYFSFMNERSYPEWTHFPLNPLLCSGVLLDEFGNINCKEVEFTEEYPNPLAFLKQLKRIGAAASVKQHSHLKDLIKVAKCGKMSVTSRITIGYCHV